MISYSSIEDMSRNRATLYRIQNNYAIEFQLDAVMRVILDKPFPGEDADMRCTRLPQWAIPGMKGLLKWFRVNERLEPANPYNFREDGFRRTSYAELAKIWSRSLTLSRSSVKAMLRALEKSGIIKRDLHFKPEEQTSELYIYFNAGKLMELINNMPFLKRKVGKETVEVFANSEPVLPGVTRAVNCPVNTSTILASSPTAVPGACDDGELPGEVFNAEEPSAPENQISKTTVEVDKKAFWLYHMLRKVFPPREFTEANVRLLERKATTFFRVHRLDEQKLQQWIRLHKQGWDEKEFGYTKLADLLNNWTHVWHVVDNELQREDYQDAEVWFYHLKNVEADCNDHAQKVWDEVVLRVSTSNVSHQEVIGNMKVWEHDAEEKDVTKQIGRFLAMRQLGCLPTLEQSQALKKALKVRPEIYYALDPRKVPLRQWAGLDTGDLFKMKVKAAKDRLRASLMLHRGALVGHTPLL